MAGVMRSGSDDYDDADALAGARSEQCAAVSGHQTSTQPSSSPALMTQYERRLSSLPPRATGTT